MHIFNPNAPVMFSEPVRTILHVFRAIWIYSESVLRVFYKWKVLSQKKNDPMLETCQ